MLKRRQDGRQKFPFFFFKNRLAKLAIMVFGPRCLLEASKSLPRASRDPPKSRSRGFSNQKNLRFTFLFSQVYLEASWGLQKACFFGSHFPTTKIHPKSSKKLPKPSPRPSQNASKTGIHLGPPKSSKMLPL